MRWSLGRWLLYTSRGGATRPARHGLPSCFPSSLLDLSASPASSAETLIFQHLHRPTPPLPDLLGRLCQNAHLPASRPPYPRRHRYASGEARPALGGSLCCLSVPPSELPLHLLRCSRIWRALPYGGTFFPVPVALRLINMLTSSRQQHPATSLLVNCSQC